MTADLRAAFATQAAACAGLGSPFMARLCTLLGARVQPGSALGDRLLAWRGDLGPRGESVPLRLCGALHALKLAGDAGLAAVYPPHDPSDAALWAALAQALTQHESAIMAFIDSPPQTNEIRRSVALIAAGHWLRARYDMPFVTRELGASGGLNLWWDRYQLMTPRGGLGPAGTGPRLCPDWSGAVPEGPAPVIAQRRGVDLNPLDPTDPGDALRLSAYLWPDQPERLSLTRAAMAQIPAPLVDRSDAIDWLAQALDPVPGHMRLIYHTVAWQYFPPGKQAEGSALIEAAGVQAGRDSPLAWLAMENDGDNQGAALTLRLWPDAPTSRLLARVSFHGQWIDWRAGV